MSSLFSSPSKQAQAAAGAEAGLTNQEIGNLENYVSGQQQKERGAISGIGQNPYFLAAQNDNPASMKVDPTNTATYANSGQGTQQSSNNLFLSPSAQASYQQPPAAAALAPAPTAQAPTAPAPGKTQPITQPTPPRSGGVVPQVVPVYNPNVRNQ